MDNIFFNGGTQYWLAIQTTDNPGWHGWLCTTQTWGDMTYFSQDNGSSWQAARAIMERRTVSSWFSEAALVFPAIDGAGNEVPAPNLSDGSGGVV